MLRKAWNVLHGNEVRSAFSDETSEFAHKRAIVIGSGSTSVCREWLARSTSDQRHNARFPAVRFEVGKADVADIRGKKGCARIVDFVGMATGRVDVNTRPNLDSRCTEPTSQPTDATENINGANFGEVPLLGHVLPRFSGLRIHGHHSQRRVFIPVRFASNGSRGLFIGASFRVRPMVTRSLRLCALGTSCLPKASPCP